MIKKILLVVLFLIGLIYLVMPGPSSINDIQQLTDSLKSNEPGDTTQVSNIAAFFSNNRRKEVTDFYKDQFAYLKIFGVNIPPVKLNHPPEEAYNYIRDQQPSTYLEQYTYPLRDAIYVNGFEPFDVSGKPYKRGATSIFIEGNYYDTKTTIRYYGSSVIWRLLIYIGIWASILLLVNLSKQLLGKKK
jgi:hypothetical protein